MIIKMVLENNKVVYYDLKNYIIRFHDGCLVMEPYVDNEVSTNTVTIEISRIKMIRNKVEGILNCTQDSIIDFLDRNIL
jgi:hypothetical protein